MKYRQKAKDVPYSHFLGPLPHKKNLHMNPPLFFSFHIIPRQHNHNPTTTTQKTPPPLPCLITVAAEELAPIPNVAPSAPPDDECEPPLLAAADGVAVTAPADDAAAAAAGLLPSLKAGVGFAGGLAVRNCAAMVGIGPHWVPLSSNFHVWEGQ